MVLSKKQEANAKQTRASWGEMLTCDDVFKVGGVTIL